MCQSGKAGLTHLKHFSRFSELKSLGIVFFTKGTDAMHSLSLPEILVILALGLLLFGNRLPTVGKSLGEGIRNFKKGLNDTKSELDNATGPAAAPVAAPQTQQAPAQPVLAQNVFPTSIEGAPAHASAASPASRTPKEAVVDVEHGDEHK